MPAGFIAGRLFLFYHDGERTVIRMDLIRYFIENGMDFDMAVILSEAFK